MLRCAGARVCRPDDTAETCIAASHQLMALQFEDAGAQAVAEAVQLSAAQCASLQAVLLHGSLLCHAVTNIAARVTMNSLVAAEGSAKVRVALPTAAFLSLLRRKGVIRTARQTGTRISPNRCALGRGRRGM